MSDLKTYNPSSVKIVIGPHIVTGVADGTFIVVEPMTDGVTSEAGAYGSVARAMSLDNRHNIRLTLQQTSRSNDALSAMHAADKISGGNGAVPILVSDLRGTTLFAGTGWVVKNAPATFSKGLEAKEWALEAVGVFTNGGTDE